VVLNAHGVLRNAVELQLQLAHCNFVEGELGLLVRDHLKTLAPHDTEVVLKFD